MVISWRDYLLNLQKSIALQKTSEFHTRTGRWFLVPRESFIAPSFEPHSNTLTLGEAVAIIYLPHCTTPTIFSHNYILKLKAPILSQHCTIHIYHTLLIDPIDLQVPKHHWQHILSSGHLPHRTNTTPSTSHLRKVKGHRPDIRHQLPYSVDFTTPALSRAAPRHH